MHDRKYRKKWHGHPLKIIGFTYVTIHTNLVAKILDTTTGVLVVVYL